MCKLSFIQWFTIIVGTTCIDYRYTCCVLTCRLNFGFSYRTLGSRGLIVLTAPLIGLWIKSKVKMRWPLALPSKVLFLSWYRRFSQGVIWKIKSISKINYCSLRVTMTLDTCRSIDKQNLVIIILIIYKYM